MNNIYLYNDTFIDLLNIIFYLLNNNITPKDIKTFDKYIPNLFDMPVSLNLKNQKINLSKNVLKSIYYVYLSSNDKKEIITYYFIKNYLKYKNEVFFHRNLNCVNYVIQISNYVSREAHKLKGFLRFQKMKNNFYYAIMSPTNNVIGILTNHFSKRLKNEYFIIKDEKRNIYAFYDSKKIIYLTDEEIKQLNLQTDEIEEEIELLWKSFFKTISIKERINLKCQRNFMPKKYWKYIIEMEDH